MGFPDRAELIRNQVGVKREKQKKICINAVYFFLYLAYSVGVSQESPAVFSVEMERMWFGDAMMKYPKRFAVLKQ